MGLSEPEPVFLASLATNLVFIVLGSVLLIFPIGIIWGRLRPDPKPPLGDYESFAGLVVTKGHESWGRLSLRDGILCFVPHEGESCEWPAAEIDHAVIEWPRAKFSISVDEQRFEFNCFKYPLTAHPGDEGRHARTVQKEWGRQLTAAGVRVLEIEPERAESGLQ